MDNILDELTIQSKAEIGLITVMAAGLSMIEDAMKSVAVPRELTGLNEQLHADAYVEYVDE
jgi:hypothetical protein